MRVITRFERKPIPTNAHDWTAFFEGQEESGFGSGATQHEAVNDLSVSTDRKIITVDGEFVEDICVACDKNIYQCACDVDIHEGQPPYDEDRSDAPICERCGKEYTWNESVAAYEHSDDCAKGKRSLNHY